MMLGMNNPYPKALTDNLIKHFGQSSLSSILNGFEKNRLPSFRVNTLKITDEEVMGILREEQIQYERVKFLPHAFIIKNLSNKDLLAHKLTTSGQIYLQGLASMLPATILLPEIITPNLKILDLCAAPGSKTSQLAALTKNKISILACEENDIRYQKLLNTISTQGATAVTARHTNSTLLHHELAETFDLILADVPCTAEGRINATDPRSYRFWSEKNILAHAKLQRRLLRSAVQCLKPGGALVYSTCTLAIQENEDMIGWLKQEFPVMTSVKITLPFLNNVKQTAHQTITVLPNELMEGFFVAKLNKKITP